MLVFYSCLIVLGVVAVIVSIINVIRLTEIHRLVNRNFSEQRAEIEILHAQLDQAIHAATVAEETLRHQRTAEPSAGVLSQDPRT